MSNKNAFLSAPALILMVVGSHARDTNVQDVPVAVTAFSGEDIARAGITSIDDLSTFVPNVNFDSSGDGTASINIRGLPSSAATVLVDGVLISGGAQSPTGLFSPSDIERIEVLKGPQGTLFGKNTTAGVVNIVTSDDYQAFDLQESWVLHDLNDMLDDYTFTIESNEECDASHGSEVPYWTFSNDWNYGLPKISSDGDLWTWGSKSNGYPSGSLYYPEQAAKIDLHSVLPFSGFTFDGFDQLQDRVNNDPSANEQDKRDFINMLLLGAAFAGPSVLSDQATGFKHFDPDKYYEEFRKFAENRSDEDRANFLSGLSVAPTPPIGTNPAPTTPPTDTAPALDDATTSNTPDPFDEFPYPPDYAFDFTDCTQEQEDKVLEIIDRRDRGRAFMSSYMDYLRQPGEIIPKQRDDDPGSLAEATEMRNSANEELRTFWKSCTNPEAAAQSLDTQSPQQTDGTSKTSLGMGYGFRDRWNLEVHLEYNDLDIDKAESDIGIDLHYKLNDSGFKIPFSLGAKYDYDVGASLGSSRTFFDADGVARMDKAIDAAPGITSRLRLEVDLSAESDGGVTFGARTETRRPAPVNDDWQIFVDYDLKGAYGGPTIGLKYDYNPIDTKYQEYVPENDVSPPTIEFLPETKDAVDYLDNFGSSPFSIGGKYFRTFSAPESADLDWSALEHLKGQTYWANDQCGDSALPDESSGYLTADLSPVKSVDDQWAFKRVGLSGNEPALDEFAKPVIVGVIDTGLDWNHRDFSWDNLWHNEGEIPDNGVDDDGNGFIDDLIGWNFTGENNRPWDRDGHGTFVSGIIAATQSNDIGIDGINSHVKIMVLKALNNFGRTRASYVARAIVYGADNGAQILNLSVSGPGFPKIVQDAVDYAESKGVLVVNAAGNDAEDIGQGELAPLERVLTVAATGTNNNRAIFSNIGTTVDIAAPGVDIVSLRARGTDFMYSSGKTSYPKEDAFLGEDRRYYRATGTSFATPIVTGIASLLLANNPGLTPADLRRVLEQSARDVETPGRDRFTGYGIVDAEAALAADPAFFIEAGISLVQPVESYGQSLVQLIGTADADQFASAVLQVGEGESPQTWMQVGLPITDGVVGGQLGQIPIEQLANSTTWTIRVLVTHESGAVREARYVIDL